MTKGIIGLVNKGQFRKPDDWGALRAWAWGAARSLDYLETDSTVDAKRAGPCRARKVKWFSGLPGAEGDGERRR